VKFGAMKTPILFAGFNEFSVHTSHIQPIKDEAQTALLKGPVRTAQ
jgi:hypothetical protein